MTGSKQKVLHNNLSHREPEWITLKILANCYSTILGDLHIECMATTYTVYWATASRVTRSFSEFGAFCVYFKKNYIK